MAITLELHTEPGLDDPQVEMSQLSGTYEMVLAQQELTLDDQNTSVKVQLRPMTHALNGNDPQQNVAERTLFGVFIQSKDGSRDTLAQTIAGPLRFRAYDANEPQLMRERSALEGIRNRVAVLSHAALRFAGLVAPMPGAKVSDAEIYESAAPGLNLLDAAYCVLNARNLGRISEDETLMILNKMHDSARSSLSAFHDLGLVHGHAHLKNFNVDPATGNVALFDYTLAMQHGHDTAIARSGWNGMNDKDYVEDVARFESRWRDCLITAGLPVGELQLTPGEQERAIVKLERAVALTALWKTTGSAPSEREIDGYMRIRRELISDAPTIAYPKAA